MTGAAGFIGRALCRTLVRQGHDVRGLVRSTAEPIAGVELRVTGNIGPRTDWVSHLDRIDVIVHLATSAHRPLDAASGMAEAEAAAALAQAAGIAGVRQLIHVSSIRAMGAFTRPGARFHAADPPAPDDSYGCAKLESERAVGAAARGDRLDLVILRPPLVYGPGVKGNFRALLALAASGVPLPFAGLDNCRSLIFLDNLVDLLGVACIHPAASNRVLLARDADLSIPELLRALGSGLGRRVPLFSVPAVLLTGLGRTPVVGSVLLRLILPLLVDDGETRSSLGWTPVIPPEIGLGTTARAYRSGS